MKGEREREREREREKEREKSDRFESKSEREEILICRWKNSATQLPVQVCAAVLTRIMMLDLTKGIIGIKKEK